MRLVGDGGTINIQEQLKKEIEIIALKALACTALLSHLTFSSLSIPLHILSALALAQVPPRGQVGVAHQVHIHLGAGRGLGAGHEGVEVLGSGRHLSRHEGVHALTMLASSSRVTLTETPLTVSIHRTPIHADVTENYFKLKDL